MRRVYGFGQVMCRIEDSPMIGEVFMGLQPWIFLAEVNRAASVWVRSNYVPHHQECISGQVMAINFLD